MKKNIIKLFITLISVTFILCACAPKPSIGSGKKEPIEEDNFKASTLEGIDGRLENYKKYKANAETAFSDLKETDLSEFEYTETNGGICITGHVGDSEMLVIPSSINGKSVIEIADGAFYVSDNKDTEATSNLRSVYVPDSVIKIGKSAFKDCAKLQLLRVPFVGDGDKNTHVGYIFGAEKYDENAVNIPVSLETIIVGELEDEIAERAFYGVKSVEAVVLQGAKSIGKFAFSGCSELVLVELSEKLEYIGDYAFTECVALSKIVIPESVKRVGLGAFYLCRSMSEMTMGVIGDGDENAYIGYIFGAESRDWNENFVPASLGKVNLLDSCKRIENKAFANCHGIVEVNFSDSIEFIGVRAFSYCRSLKTLKTPSSLSVISGDAFLGCDNLESVTIEGATKIGAQAFFGCKNISEKNISPEAVVDGNAFL